MQSLLPYLLIGLGGFLGANARFILAGWSNQLFGPLFPYGTFFVNVSGSFLLGFLLPLLQAGLFPHSRPMIFLFCIGFIGSYTTFSTFEYETHKLFDEGSWLLALVNIFGSMFVGMLAVHLGIGLARRWL
ncbi:MAG: fluoride efflux transporter CrcB [Candidatus Sumerlaeaceae bacterium]|nr:fluoride efflux transporter CrcB [Candidatus Sumerlaeaceae bacterium]